LVFQSFTEIMGLRDLHLLENFPKKLKFENFDPKEGAHNRK